MSDERQTPELSELEAALGGLSPRPASVDRDALLYRAGRAAGARPWRRATAISTLFALALAGVLVTRPVVERPVPVPAPTAPDVDSLTSPDVESVPSHGGREGPSLYLQMQEQVLSRGLDGLPSFQMRSEPGSPAPAEEFRRGL
jgi:hypothetical protein